MTGVEVPHLFCPPEHIEAIDCCILLISDEGLREAFQSLKEEIEQTSEVFVSFSKHEADPADCGTTILQKARENTQIPVYLLQQSVVVSLKDVGVANLVGYVKTDSISKFLEVSLHLGAHNEKNWR